VSTESEEFPLLLFSVIEIEFPLKEDGTSPCLRQRNRLAVPFGVVVAPQVFTRVFQTVIAHLHTLSVQAHSYLDDSLLEEFDSEILSRHTCLLIRLLLDLGVLISLKVSDTSFPRLLAFWGNITGQI
jgi:hypothetical protein